MPIPLVVAELIFCVGMSEYDPKRVLFSCPVEMKLEVERYIDRNYKGYSCCQMTPGQIETVQQICKDQFNENADLAFQFICRIMHLLKDRVNKDIQIDSIIGDTGLTSGKKVHFELFYKINDEIASIKGDKEYFPFYERWDDDGSVVNYSLTDFIKDIFRDWILPATKPACRPEPWNNGITFFDLNPAEVNVFMTKMDAAIERYKREYEEVPGQLHSAGNVPGTSAAASGANFTELK